MFVKIVQKWNAFKQNWDEYRKLRRVAARAWHKLGRVRNKITVVYRECEPRPQKHCIASKILEIQPLSTTNDGLGNNMPTIIVIEKYCPYFNNGEKAEHSCNEKTCPQYAAHCEYISAAQEYKAAVEQRRTFWERVRNKTK